jgi:WD40 repeat protein
LGPALSDGGTVSGGPSDAAASALLGRWWGTLSAPSSGSGPLAALDVVTGSGGEVTATLWFSEMAHPALIAPTADPTQLALLGQGTITLGQDTFTLKVAVDEPEGGVAQVTSTFYRSHARLVHPGAFSPKPTVFSADGSTLAYFDGTHPWEWDANRQTRLDMAASVDAGLPSMGLGFSSQVAVSPDGSRSAYCVWPGVPGLPPLFVFDTATAQAQTIADYAPCAARSFSFSADGQRLAAPAADSPYPGSASLGLRVWDLTTRSATAVPNTTSPDVSWLSASGRYLLYATGATPSLGSYGSLSVYDVDAKSATSLGAAAWLTRSPGDRYLAFVGYGNRVVVWSDDTGAATQFDALGQGTNASPLQLSPDGQKITYGDSNHDQRLLVFGNSASTRAASAVSCAVGTGGTQLVRGVSEAIFSPDSRALITLANDGSPCDMSGSTAQAIHVHDIGSGTDHSLALPAATAFESAGIVAVSSSAVVYAFSNTPGPTEMHLWSTAGGDVILPLPYGDGVDLYEGLSQDNSRLLYVPGVGDPVTAYLWDRTAGATPLVTFSGNPLPPFFATLNPQSGVAVGYDGSAKAFVVARPGSPPAPWVQGDDFHIVSPSGNTFAIAGTSGSEQGLFAISLPSGNAGFLEGGQLLAATDTHVYFIAADGLCEAPTP